MSYCDRLTPLLATTAGLDALVSVLTELRDNAETRHTDLAKKALWVGDNKPFALAAQGEAKGIQDVLDLIKQLRSKSTI